MKILILLLPVLNSLSIAIFPGLGDDCFNPLQISFRYNILKKTNLYTACIEYHIPGFFSTYFTSLKQQAWLACKSIQFHQQLQGEVIFLGMSQGSIIARSVIETCEFNAKVIRYVSIGGPQMGVSYLPFCANNILCYPLTTIVKLLVYVPIVQELIGPAGLFRDISNPLHDYKTSFIANLNNEAGQVDQKKIDNILNLEGMLLIMFTKDNMVQPPESEWFQQLDENGKLLKLEESEFYKKDLLGIKKLNEAGKIFFLAIESDHLGITKQHINEYVIPFILGDKVTMPKGPLKPTKA